MAIRNYCEAGAGAIQYSGDMNTPVALLLTNDNELEKCAAEALSQVGAVAHLTRDAGEALETICGADDIDVAIINFEHGPHGMTLLGAISTLREDLPVIAIGHDDEEHVKALAYANGATAFLSKRTVATQLADTIRELSKSTPEPVFA
jgi:DNA-binding NtrC family response regulator